MLVLSSNSWFFLSLSCPPPSSTVPPKAVLSTARPRSSHYRPDPPCSRHLSNRGSSSISHHRGHSGSIIGEAPQLLAIKSVSSQWSTKTWVFHRIAAIIGRGARARKGSLPLWGQLQHRDSRLITHVTISHPECRHNRCLVLNMAVGAASTHSSKTLSNQLR